MSRPPYRPSHLIMRPPTTSSGLLPPGSQTLNIDHIKSQHLRQVRLWEGPLRLTGEETWLQRVRGGSC